MAELSFTVPPQVDLDGATFDVAVRDANPVFLDAEDFVHITIFPAGVRRPESLTEDPRVRRNEDDVFGAIARLAASAAAALAKQRERARRLRGGL